MISSTSCLSNSQRTRLRLPCTCSSPAGLAFSSLICRCEITGRDGRVRPLRCGDRRRCHVLGLGVQCRPDRAVARIVPRSPGAGKDLIGPPAEQEGVGALVDLTETSRGLAVEQRRGPAAALESAPAVLIGPAKSLEASSQPLRKRRRRCGSTSSTVADRRSFGNSDQSRQPGLMIAFAIRRDTFFGRTLPVPVAAALLGRWGLVAFSSQSLNATIVGVLSPY